MEVHGLLEAFVVDDVVVCEDFPFGSEGDDADVEGNAGGGICGGESGGDVEGGVAAAVLSGACGFAEGIVGRCAYVDAQGTVGGTDLLRHFDEEKGEAEVFVVGICCDGDAVDG